MSSIEELANLAVAAFGAVAAAWAAAKWLRRPRFICGIPPTIEERAQKEIPRGRLGDDAVATAFRHRRHCFAQPLRRPHRRTLAPRFARSVLADQERCRTIATDPAGRARIPILIANQGRRVADYTATVTLYADGGKVHVVDVVTETLPVYLYADEPARVASHVERADSRIVAGYDAYMMDPSMNRWGDVIALAHGHLEAGLFELLVVDVEIEDGLDEFFVIYTLDCADAWTGVRTFIQGCRVERTAVEA